MSSRPPSHKANSIANEIRSLIVDTEKLAQSDIRDPVVRQGFDRALDTLRRRANEIDPKIPSDSSSAELRAQFKQVKDQLEQLDFVVQRQILEIQKPPERSPSDGFTQEELDLARQEGEDLDDLNKKITEIVKQQKVLLDLSQQLAEIIAEGHKKIIHTDELIKGAVQNMEKGNEELEKAETDQKRGGCDVS
jgi:methyl-accepting chemotaxis protein